MASTATQLEHSVVKQLGRLIQKQVRDCDLAGRIGIEEFVLAMVDTQLQGALQLAEKVLKAVSHFDVQHHSQTPNCTISVGVATADWTNPVSFQQLCEQADNALPP